jgi:hypothetical protein
VEPIHYSLLFNILVLASALGLAFQFANPLIFVIGLLCIQHTMAKFDDRDDDDDGPSGGAPMGFV